MNPTGSGEAGVRHDFLPRSGLRDVDGRPLTAPPDSARLLSRWESTNELQRLEDAQDLGATLIFVVLDGRPARLWADVALPDERERVETLWRAQPDVSRPLPTVFAAPVNPLTLSTILDCNQITLEIWTAEGQGGQIVAAVGDSVLEGVLFWLRPDDVDRLQEEIARHARAI